MSQAARSSTTNGMSLSSQPFPAAASSERPSTLTYEIPVPRADSLVQHQRLDAGCRPRPALTRVRRPGGNRSRRARYEHDNHRLARRPRPGGRRAYRRALETPGPRLSGARHLSRRRTPSPSPGGRPDPDWPAHRPGLAPVTPARGLRRVNDRVAVCRYADVLAAVRRPRLRPRREPSRLRWPLPLSFGTLHHAVR